MSVPVLQFSLPPPPSHCVGMSQSPIEGSAKKLTHALDILSSKSAVVVGDR